MNHIKKLATNCLMKPFQIKKKSQIKSRASPPVNGDKRNLRHGPPEKVRSRNRKNRTRFAPLFIPKSRLKNLLSHAHTSSAS